MSYNLSLSRKSPRSYDPFSLPSTRFTSYHTRRENTGKRLPVCPSVGCCASMHWRGGLGAAFTCRTRNRSGGLGADFATILHKLSQHGNIWNLCGTNRNVCVGCSRQEATNTSQTWHRRGVPISHQRIGLASHEAHFHGETGLLKIN